MGLSNRHQVQEGHTSCGGHKGCHTHLSHFCHCGANHSWQPCTTSVALNSMASAVDSVSVANLRASMPQHLTFKSVHSMNVTGSSRRRVLEQLYQNWRASVLSSSFKVTLTVANLQSVELSVHPQLVLHLSHCVLRD